MGRSTRRSIRCWAAVLATTMGMTVLLGATPAAAATSYTATGLSAATSGASVTATATIASSSTVSATRAGICARNSGGGIVDFPMSSASLTSSGRTFTQRRDLSAGTYTYWACAKVSGSWHDIGAKKSFTVGVVSSVATPSGQAMPVGNLPGWRQTFSEDFPADVSMGGFPGPYADKWGSYNGFKDSSGRGMYSRNYISTRNGLMDLYLHSVNGVPQGAGPFPLINSGKWGGQIYGRFSIRFKADPVVGYGAGWLLWPDSGDWNDGEIDMPEGGFAHTIQAFNHNIGDAKVNSLVVQSGVTWTSWHTATIDWTPSSVSFILDGRVIGRDTKSIPRKPLHWVLQTGTTSQVSTTSSGHVLIDWVTAYAYAP